MKDEEQQDSPAGYIIPPHSQAVPMVDGGLSLLAPALRPLVAAVAAAMPHIKVVRAEKSAAVSPFASPANSLALDAQFGDALTRLGAISENHSWWEGLLRRFELQFVQPELFEKPAIREWLSRDEVKAGLSALARARLRGLSPSEETWAGLRTAYSEATLEASILADGAIEIAVAVLVAGRMAALSPGQQVLMDGLQGNSQQLAELSHKIGHVVCQSPNPIIDGAIRQELRKICRRRTVPGIDVRPEICALLERIENGELTSASRPIIGEVLLWAARLHAADAASGTAAADYLAKAEAIIPGSSDAAIAKAWLLFHAESPDEALRFLRSQNTSHARSVMLLFLCRSNGDSDALEWFDAHGSVENDFFSPAGWKNLAILRHNARQWDGAVEVLEKLADIDMAAEPDILYVLGTFHAGFLLPEPIRQRVLTFTSITPGLQVNEGEQAELHRAAAITRFRQARDLLLEIDAQDRVKGCDYWLLWLGLSAPSTRAETATRLRQQIAAGPDGLFFVDLAITYGVDFDHEAVERHFRVRELDGGLTPQEHVARLGLLRFRSTPQRLLDYLDSAADQLKDFITPAHLALMRVEALIADRRLDAAERILDEDPVLKDDPEVSGARLAIADLRGQDVLGDAIRLYDQGRDHDESGSRLSDLKNIVTVLLREKRWSQMLPYAQELFGHERTARNLGLATDCSSSVHGHQATLDILEAHPDLVHTNSDIGRHLMEKKADCLFRLGRFREARDINDQLLTVSPDDPRYIHHDLNIALRSGAWEHFAAVLDRQLEKRESLDLTVLMHLAQMISNIVPDRAMDLLKVAAKREPGNPQLQLNCYMLASTIGRDHEAGLWLQRGVELSKDGQGPVRSVSLRELVDMAPAHARERDEKHRRLFSGEIALHMASMDFRVPMSRFFIVIPRANERERDARKRLPIAIRAGNRPPIAMGGVGTIALDVSTLLLLHELDLFDAVVAAVGHVKVSPRLMDFLAREMRELPYHQPSLVDEARTLRSHVSAERIAVLKTEAVDTRLIAEFGDEMARLVAAAKSQGGRVVAPAEMHKIGSLMEEFADWGDAAPLVLSTPQLAEGIRHLGYIDQGSCDTACQFLMTQDRGIPPGPQMRSEQPLFIDNLALKHLTGAGLLDKLAQCGIPLFIDRSTDQEARDLIAADEEGRSAVEVLQALRRRVAECYRQGTLSFLPEAAVVEDDKGPEKDDRMLLLYDLFNDVETVDAIALDDRWLGRHSNAADKAGRTVPLFGITDLLGLCGISDEQRLQATRRLWRRGFAFLPLHESNLLTDLTNCYWDDGAAMLRESAELRAVRETLCRIRSLKMLRIGDDHAWLDHLAQTAVMTIVNIWSDEAIVEPRARALSDWLIDNVTPWPVGWQDSLAEGHWIDVDLGMAQRLFQLLILRPPDASEMRQAAYGKWADERLVQPFRATSPGVIDLVAQSLAQQFAGMISEIPDESEG
ncbi:hypothetical protein [Magnetospirillum sp. SS-4]|uniref:HTH domain-containing protein n=1 Tax=Magnetospirillum sp. SS-4 TaxID=2681465 RepID=UPI0015748875|nr:hypothetical protein [Magnetospirillum sp. SS-4]